MLINNKLKMDLKNDLRNTTPIEINKIQEQNKNSKKLSMHINYSKIHKEEEFTIWLDKIILKATLVEGSIKEVDSQEDSVLI